MISEYWTTFVELIRTPFAHTGLIWGIVPLYFGLFLNELESSKANFRTALQTGFSFVWAAVQWLYPYFKAPAAGAPEIHFTVMQPIKLFVTFSILAMGVVAMFSGIRRRFPKYCGFLGRTRFSNYFMITIFPIQAHFLDWTWNRVIVVVLFAGPVWLLLHFGLMPFRKK